MSTGLVIQKATYGSPSGTPVDVTSAVASKVNEGAVSFTVSPSAFAIDDPAPGQLKEAYVAYTINGGSKNEILVKDGGLVQIDAPPQRMASGLQIVKAEYGYPGNWTDVTDAVQNLMKSDGSINIKVGFKELGLPDPNPNKQKQLAVQYSINGAPSTQTLTDGQSFKLSAPALEDSSGPKMKDQVTSFIWMLFMSVVRFLSTFLYFLSIFVAYDYGNYFVHPYVWGIAAFFLPLFAFWGLPLITFVVRLFKSTDIVPA